VQLQYGEGAQVTVAISGALEVTAVVTVTYSTPSLNGGVPCFFIGTFGPPGPLVVPNLPAPPTAGWVNVQAPWFGSTINTTSFTNAATGTYPIVAAGGQQRYLKGYSLDGDAASATVPAYGTWAIEDTAGNVMAMGRVNIQTNAGNIVKPSWLWFTEGIPTPGGGTLGLRLVVSRISPPDIQITGTVWWG
jgi:hypothetical protein